MVQGREAWLPGPCCASDIRGRVDGRLELGEERVDVPLLCRDLLCGQQGATTCRG